MLKKIDAFHNTRKGYAVFGLVELLLAYIVFSVAIDTGSILYYALGFLLLLGVLSNVSRFIKTYATRPKRSPKKA